MSRLELRAVGVGLPPTATSSLREALERLGSLGVSVPDEPFPWTNRREDWR